jgi:Flp pilus assembly CpaE family ATPase
MVNKNSVYNILICKKEGAAPNRKLLSDLEQLLSCCPWRHRPVRERCCRRLSAASNLSLGQKARIASFIGFTKTGVGLPPEQGKDGLFGISAF